MNIGTSAVATLAAFALVACASARANDRIAASEVTDRPTLGAFVEGAKGYLEGITTLSETARLRDVFRTEGRWKSGSLYLSILMQNGPSCFTAMIRLRSTRT